MPINIFRPCFIFRFLLIKFFNHIGAVGPSQVVHMGLELKHIQLDSLGHLMSRHIASCGHFNETAKYFRNTLRFFTGNYKDTIDYIISAYRCGSFDKIREFIKHVQQPIVFAHFWILRMMKIYPSDMQV